MHFTDLRGRRRAPGADRPDGFIGDDEVVGIGARRQRADQLRGNDLDRAVLVALGERLAYAQDRGHPRLQHGGGLRLHDRVRLGVLGAPFGMADDDEAAAGILQHVRRHVAGESPRRLGVAVLRAQPHAAARQDLRDGRQIGIGRADEHVGSRRWQGAHEGRHGTGKLGRVGKPTVHLPVSGNQRFGPGHARILLAILHPD